MILKVMASRGTVASVESRRLSTAVAVVFTFLLFTGRVKNRENFH